METLKTGEQFRPGRGLRADEQLREVWGLVVKAGVRGGRGPAWPQGRTHVEAWSHPSGSVRPGHAAESFKCRSRRKAQRQHGAAKGGVAEEEGCVRGADVLSPQVPALTPCPCFLPTAWLQQVVTILSLSFPTT